MTRRPGDPEEGTIKRLFALTGNRCAFQSVDAGTGCENQLARPEWPRTRSRVCHIAGEKPGAPRFDPKMSVQERKAFENLIVLCPTHSDHIDYIEPDKYTVAVLTEMKRRHEELCTDTGWASPVELSRYAELVLLHQFGVIAAEPLLLSDEAKATDSLSVGVGGDAATGAGAHDATVETPAAEAGQLKGFQAEVKFGELKPGEA